MILGIGTDIIEVDRIEGIVDRYGQQFLNRIFTSAEQEYCHKYRYPNQHRAGRFAAKEATAKALGTGIGKEISWTDIEILNNERGKPQVYLSPAVRNYFSDLDVHLSISHSKQYATAVALAVSCRG